MSQLVILEERYCKIKHLFCHNCLIIVGILIKIKSYNFILIASNHSFNVAFNVVLGLIVGFFIDFFVVQYIFSW